MHDNPSVQYDGPIKLYGYHRQYYMRRPSCIVVDGIVGGLSAVHQFCSLGKMSILGTCTKVVSDVAPFMMVDGNPARTRAVNKVGLERNGVAVEAQEALRRAHRLLFRKGLTTGNALGAIRTEVPQLDEVKHLVSFVETSDRGITR